MKHMDRAYQRQLLERLADAYPKTLEAVDLGASDTDPRLAFNLAYLAGHGLVTAQFQASTDGPHWLVEAAATHAGLDFLQADGGLSAVLGTVTVRFEADTLRAIIAARVSAADAPAEDKSKVMAWLKDASSEALKTATQRLVEASLDRLPQALQLLTTLID